MKDGGVVGCLNVSRSAAVSRHSLEIVVKNKLLAFVATAFEILVVLFTLRPSLTKPSTPICPHLLSNFRIHQLKYNSI